MSRPGRRVGRAPLQQRLERDLAEIRRLRQQGYSFVTYGEGGPRPMTDQQAAQAFLQTPQGAA